MAIFFGALYDALRRAQVPEDAARVAAEELASYESRLRSLETNVAILRWLVAANLVLTAAVLLSMSL